MRDAWLNSVMLLCITLRLLGVTLSLWTLLFHAAGHARCVAELCAGLPQKHLKQLLGIASLDRETEAPIGQGGKAYSSDLYASDSYAHTLNQTKGGKQGCDKGKPKLQGFRHYSAAAHDVADQKSIRGGGGGRRLNCNTLMLGEILEPEARRSIALALSYCQLV
jgi:hypothetical protein